MDIQSNDIIARLELQNTAVARQAIAEIQMLRAALAPFAAKLHVAEHQQHEIKGWVGIAVQYTDIVAAHAAYNKGNGRG